tara:strand:- start:220 stop:1035 length:816 start_codon:yes stop_codon:yes gene_type:complete
MDKIRAAISKARADRETLGVPRPRGSKPLPVDAISANWAALPVEQFDANLMRKNRIVSYARSPESTGIDMMRTRILQQMHDNNWRRLAITSPTASCGKSTVALNLAVSMSRQPDLRSMLLELDLRRPSLARMLGINPRPVDFTDVLRGNTDFAQNAACYDGNLAVGLNSTKTRNASELLSGAGISDTLAQLDATYRPDITIFDMPPMLAADDMMAFATQVDCVLIIAAAERSTTREIDICEQDLARQTNVMGVVLNECRYMGAEAGYEYDA